MNPRGAAAGEAGAAAPGKALQLRVGRGEEEFRLEDDTKRWRGRA